MPKSFVIKHSLLALLISTSSLGVADDETTTSVPIEIRINLSDSNNTLRFFPSHLDLRAGILYKLVLHNPSEQAHYFSSEGLSRSISTKQVLVLNSLGKRISEIKGHIKEIELYPEGTVEWWFVPTNPIVLDDLRCLIKGHARAGMVGTIEIRSL